MDYLKSEVCDKNLLFWLACQELKRETNSEKIKTEALQIYQEFIAESSPNEVIGFP